MYQPSQNFINELNKTSRLFRARITCGTDTLTEEIKKMIFTLGSCGADTFTIGSVFASYVDITLSSTELSLAGKEMFVEIGLLLPDGTVEYIPMGYFTASPADISKSRDQTILKATDRISSKCGGLYIPSITFPATIQAVMNDVSTQAGITIKTSLPATGVIQKEMKNLTCRDVLGFLAGLLGGFCYADRGGNICIAAYPSTSSLTIENERSWSMEMGEEYSVDSLKVIVSEGGEDADGNEVSGVSYSAGSGNGITVSNQYMTESLFNDMKSRVLNYNFCSGTARVLGDPRLDPADAITVINFAGKEFFVPCMSITHEYDGGLATTITTPSQAASDEEVRGPLTQQVEQLAADMVLAKEVIAKKITADEADLKFATIERANIIEAEIDKVSGEFADYKVIVTEDFTAVNAEINTVKGDLADYKTVIADDFTAVNAEITTVKGDLADYKTVVAGDIDALSGRITLVSGELADYKTVVSNELITAKGWMAEGSIGNAQISSVDATKIKSGILDTALVTVKGTNGNLQIIDNTISISDSARVRVQVGKDGTGDYTLAVWDAAGNLIWDALGATENTIQRPIIRDEVVADDAAIKGTKLDIESVVTAVNGATTKISGTVVQVGNKTLNVTLSEQETTITEQGQQISDHETRITANEESIKLKVSSRDFETYKSTVEGEITTVKSRLSTAETSITAMEGQIALKVEQTDIDTAISNVEIGGRNLLKKYIRAGGGCSKIDDSTIKVGTTVGDTYFYLRSHCALTAGETYTISCEASNVPDGCNWSFGVRNEHGTWQLYINKNGKNFATGVLDTDIGADADFILDDFNGKPSTAPNIILTNFKLEKGNKATDWTPAPEDTEESITTISNKQSEIITNLDSITTRVSSVESAQTTQAGEVASMESRLTVAEQLVTKDGIISTVGSYYTTLDDVNGAVNEIEVGGRNLLRHTGNLTKWNKESGISVTPDSDGWYKITADSSLTSGRWGIYQDFSGYEQNTDYTVSLYLKNGSNAGNLSIGYGEWGQIVITGSSTETKYSYTFNTGNNTAALRIYICLWPTATGKNFYVKLPKLEKGNKATDWTPAPEDMVDKANIVSCINQTPESITIQANKISLEGLITANGGFKVLEDGSVETINGKFSGAINIYNNDDLIGKWDSNGFVINKYFKSGSETTLDSFLEIDSSENITKVYIGKKRVGYCNEDGVYISPDDERYVENDGRFQFFTEYDEDYGRTVNGLTFGNSMWICSKVDTDYPYKFIIDDLQAKLAYINDLYVDGIRVSTSIVGSSNPDGLIGVGYLNNNIRALTWVCNPGGNKYVYAPRISGYYLYAATNGDYNAFSGEVTSVARQGVTDIVFFNAYHNGAMRLNLFYVKTNF